MDVEKFIGVGADGLTVDEGEGIFGYGTPDGSLGFGPFQAPPVFANRRKQGIFFNPYSYKSYEAEEPECQWAYEKWPGIPPFPGSSARGMVLVGPSMGGIWSESSTGMKLAIIGAAGLAIAGLIRLVNG